MKFSLQSPQLSTVNILDQIIEFNYLAVVFLVPIWFAYFLPSYNIFEFNKLIIFRSLVWSLLLLTSIRTIFFSAGTLFAESEKHNRWAILKKYFLIPALLLVFLFFTLLFSINYRQSFFGSYERQQGVSSYCFYFLWALLVFINLNAKSKLELLPANYKLKINRIIIVAVASAALVSLYGILQILNLDFLTWPEEPYLTGRTLSTMGQPNFLASFLLLTIPLSAYLFYVSRHFLIKSVYAFITVIQLICLFTTASRGGLLALMITAILFVAYLFFVSGLKKQMKLTIVGVSIAIGFLGIVIIETITPGRLQESFNLGAGSFAARINFFQAASDAIIKKPVLGYGLENGGDVFIKYYERDWGLYANVSSNTDRAHNIVLDIILNVGLIGLFFFTLWYYLFFKLSFTEITKKNNNALALALTFGAVSYLASLLFSFSVIVTEVYFWLFFSILATLNFQTAGGLKFTDNVLVDKTKIKVLRRILVLLIFIIFVWQISKNIEALIADAYLNDIYVAFGKQELVQSLVLHDYIRELNINPVQMTFYNHFVGENLSDRYEQARDASSRYLVKVRMGQILNDLPDRGYNNILLKARISSQLEDYQASDKYFQMLLEVAPNWPLAHLNRARDFLRRGDLERAEASYQLVDMNLPDINSPKINDSHRKTANYYKYTSYSSLGDAYFIKQDFNQALRFYSTAYESLPSDYALLKKIADSYYLLGDVNSALKYVGRGAIFGPLDYNWQVALSALYFEQGNKESALMHINEAIKLSPEKEELKKIREKYNN